MRKELIALIKEEITESLSAYLRAEGIAFYVAANDNIPQEPMAVVLEAVTSTPLFCDKLVTEMCVLFGIFGKPAQCDLLIDALYTRLHPYQLSLPEMNILLMSMHVESTARLPRRRMHKKTVMRYIMEAEKEIAEEIKAEREAEQA